MTNLHTPTAAPRLLADVGGTNARFAWQAGPGAPIAHIRTLACADHPTLQAAIEAYIQSLPEARPTLGVIAIACDPTVGDWVQMTNHHWSFSIQDLQQGLRLSQLEVINDFTALALALPSLSDEDKRPIVSAASRAKRLMIDGPIALIGAGTGLGVSGLLPDGQGGWVALAGEGGHVTLSGLTPRETLVVAGLAERFGHVSAERAVSGQGLLNICQLLCAADQVQAQPSDPAQVVQWARAGQPQALEAVTLLCDFMATVAGNLALTLGAKGGVYIGGGVVPKLGDLFDPERFRQRFAAKGRYEDFLNAIPMWLITAEQSPALQGAASVADRWGAGV
jgi:glucokinase